MNTFLVLRRCMCTSSVLRIEKLCVPKNGQERTVSYGLGEKNGIFVLNPGVPRCIPLSGTTETVVAMCRCQCGLARVISRK